jgi:hypothetical protein
MYRDDDLHINQKPEWQLLLQFIPPAGPAGEHHSGQRVTEAVRELGLPPAEAERIGKAIAEILRETPRQGSQAQHDLAVLIRVWISRAGARDRWRYSPEPGSDEQPGRCAYGFFTIQWQEDDLQAFAGKPHQVIELYLYQESASKRS